MMIVQGFFFSKLNFFNCSLHLSCENFLNELKIRCSIVAHCVFNTLCIMQYQLQLFFVRVKTVVVSNFYILNINYFSLFFSELKILQDRFFKYFSSNWFIKQKCEFIERHKYGWRYAVSCNSSVKKLYVMFLLLFSFSLDCDSYKFIWVKNVFHFIQDIFCLWYLKKLEIYSFSYTY